MLAFNDLTQGRDPRDRLTGPEPADAAGRDARQDKPAAGGPPGDGDGTSDSDEDASWDGCPDMTQWQHERRGTTEDAGHPDSGGVPPGPPAPFPALINLTIPAGTILGWSAAPGEAGSWGLLDPGDTRRLLQAASLHPRTRWCATLLAPDGTAAAHGCARGPHPWTPPPDSGQRNRDGPDTRQAAALATLLRDLNLTFTPIAKGSCDHTNAENRYTPSRKLGHLIRARTATCPAPGCGAHAYHNDLDHTVPHPAGPTDECNIAPSNWTDAANYFGNVATGDGIVAGVFALGRKGYIETTCRCIAVDAESFAVPFFEDGDEDFFRCAGIGGAFENDELPLDADAERSPLRYRGCSSGPVHGAH